MRWAFITAAAVQLVAGCASTTATNDAILGAKPSYELHVPASFPNQQAITPRIWAPGLDDGWTPQGLAIVGRHALVSSYQEARPSEPKCRVFRIDLASGATTGFFDMPEPCKHAGGIADIGGGRIVLADTRQDWIVDLEPALRDGKAEGHTQGMIKLGTGCGSAFTFFDGKDLWNGVWVEEKNAADAKIYRVPLELFARPTPYVVTRENALDVVPIPIEVQGAALDAHGNLWLSASYHDLPGHLYRVDRKSGAILAHYVMPPRIENISFDADGKLWAISESAALKYRHDKAHFPFIFEIDVSKLK